MASQELAPTSVGSTVESSRREQAEEPLVPIAPDRPLDSPKPPKKRRLEGMGRRVHVEPCPTQPDPPVGEERDYDQREGAMALAQLIPAKYQPPEPVNTQDLEQTLALLEQFICPLSQRLFVDPVLAEDGQLYERSAIETWLTSTPMSPIHPTQFLSLEKLKPVDAVCQAIQRILTSKELANSSVRAEWEAQNYKVRMQNAKALLAKGQVGDAAKLGLPRAQSMLAEMYFLGKSGVVEKDQVRAVHWARLGAQGGDQYAQFRLGNFYNEGVGGLEVDFAEASKWYLKAAEKGNRVAMNDLGVLYEEGGHGLERDMRIAIHWFQQAAALGDEDAQCNLADCFLEGNGVPRNPHVALDWYRKSAAQGHVAACRQLGTLLLAGAPGHARDWSPEYSSEAGHSSMQHSDQRKPPLSTTHINMVDATSGSGDTPEDHARESPTDTGKAQQLKKAPASTELLPGLDAATGIKMWQHAAQEGDDEAKKYLTELTAWLSGSTRSWFQS
uniref:U-box domain-containing protein n=1 Tax=Rhizochromulina marina TaxID=1034831 RepID=A0A7S2S2H8_9STRA|mmetsp:Transcript_24168/g.70926  ORF Transcript_24168/g.70926 Transcript_24168/m.70926 type:complete len:500 (+) Transcript_24168:100-1599(+)